MDSCQRNAIEGRNGNAKHRFGLDLIMSKLDETAKTEAALVILAMNASCRLARWLVRLFCRLLSPPDFRAFQQALYSIIPNHFNLSIYLTNKTESYFGLFSKKASKTNGNVLE